MTILYYIDELTDEVMPCEPTLEAWAAYLADPAAEGDEIDPAKPGDTFNISTIEVLGDVRVELADGRVEAVEPIPDGTTYFYLRWHEGGDGWDVENSGDDVETTCCELDPEEYPVVWLACTKGGPNYLATFEIIDGKPVLQLDHKQGRAA